jgi:hypothetical protein
VAVCVGASVAVGWIYMAVSVGDAKVAVEFSLGWMEVTVLHPYKKKINIGKHAAICFITISSLDLKLSRS